VVGLVQQVQWMDCPSTLDERLPCGVGQRPRGKRLAITKQCNQEALIKGEWFFIFLFSLDIKALDGHQITSHQCLADSGPLATKI